MNKYLKLLFALIILVNININNASINNIINNGYNRMLNRVKSERSQDIITDNIENKNKDYLNIFGGEDKSNENNDHEHLPGYNCVHDIIAKDMGINYESSFKAENENQLLKSTKSLKGTNAAAAAQTLRFYFDTRFLYNGTDIAACAQVGQVVYLGGSSRNSNPSPGPCDGTSSYCYYTCKSGDVLSVDVANLISRDILTTVQDTLGKMLLVQRESGNLIFPIYHARYPSRTCDFGYTIPDYYFTTGVPNADIVVFVTSRPVFSTSTIAYAAPCIYTNGNRPLAATINFNPRYFSPFVSSNKPSSFIFNEYVRVGIHEMTHGLGFTFDFFKYFRDSNGLSYSPQPGSNVSSIGYSGSNVRYTYNRPAISTPAVKDFVQNHYQCFNDSFGYQLLEDYGMRGTVGSHWEKRTVGEEYMLGYVSPVFPITGLTLSLFQDMGWYQVDPSLAEPLMWGKGLGCDWFNNCDRKGWNYPGYFCEDSKTMSCSPTRVGKGVCNLDPDDWSRVPDYYQHFSNPNKIGDIISDGCTFYEVGTHYCVDENNSGRGDPNIGEYYGQDSRCFEYSSATNEEYRNLACWKTRCDNDTTLQIEVNGIWVSCTYPGRKFLINQVSFQCPDYFYPCKNTNSYQPPTDSTTLKYPGISYTSSSSKLLFSNSILIFIILIIFINY